jgi:hypothetical protein
MYFKTGLRRLAGVAGALAFLGGASLCHAGFIGTVGAIDDDGVLVGSSFNPHQDNVARINDVIGDGINQVEAPPLAENGWNDTFGPPALPLALDELASLEGATTTGSYSESDFDWYTNVNNGNPSVVWTAPDGSTATFYEVASPNFGTDAILAFMFNGMAGDDADIAYYTAKSDAEDGGFSVWSYIAGGLNVAYVDTNGDIDSSAGSVVFDPRSKLKINEQNGKEQLVTFGISHIKLYSADDGPDVNEETPEPSSIILLGMGGLGLIGRGWRRRKAKLAA